MIHQHPPPRHPLTGSSHDISHRRIRRETFRSSQTDFNSVSWAEKRCRWLQRSLGAVHRSPEQVKSTGLCGHDKMCCTPKQRFLPGVMIVVQMGSIWLILLVVLNITLANAVPAGSNAPNDLISNLMTDTSVLPADDSTSLDSVPEAEYVAKLCDIQLVKACLIIDGCSSSSDTDCASDDRVNYISDKDDSKKRNVSPSTCRAKYPPEKKKLGTQTRRRPFNIRPNPRLEADTPCQLPFPLYLSCGGPEIIYGPNAKTLREVKDCMIGKLTSASRLTKFYPLINVAVEPFIPSRGIFEEKDQVNEYCCEQFQDEVRSSLLTKTPILSKEYKITLMHLCSTSDLWMVRYRMRKVHGKISLRPVHEPRMGKIGDTAVSR